MMDRELLEAAAKAAGYKIYDWLPGAGLGFCIENISGRWDPLVSDSDALRLAVRLCMSVCVEVDQTWVCVAGMPAKPLAFEWHGQDPCAATRRAIVRAAAAMAPK